MTKVQNLLSLMEKGMKTEQTFIKKVSYYVIHNAAHANVNFSRSSSICSICHENREYLVSSVFWYQIYQARL